MNSLCPLTDGYGSGRGFGDGYNGYGGGPGGEIFFSFMLLSSNDTIYVPEYMYIL